MHCSRLIQSSALCPILDAYRAVAILSCEHSGERFKAVPRADGCGCPYFKTIPACFQEFYFKHILKVQVKPFRIGKNVKRIQKWRHGPLFLYMFKSFKRIKGKEDFTRIQKHCWWWIEVENCENEQQVTEEEDLHCFQILLRHVCTGCVCVSVCTCVRTLISLFSPAKTASCQV